MQESLNVGFDQILHLRNEQSHISSKCYTRLVYLHDSASSAMLALPNDVTSDRLVSCHEIPPCQFIGETVSVCVENKTTNSAECFDHKELDFGIKDVGLHQPSKPCFRQRESEIKPVKKGVNLKSHFRRRSQGALGAFTPCLETPTANANPLFMSPLFQTESPVSQSACSCSPQCQKISSGNRPNTLETPYCWKCSTRTTLFLMLHCQVHNNTSGCQTHS